MSCYFALYGGEPPLIICATLRGQVSGNTTIGPCQGGAIQAGQYRSPLQNL